MRPLVPEPNKKPGLCYAVTDEGLELPVIDVTHPAFILEPSEAEILAVRDKYHREAKLRARLPGFLRDLLVNGLAKRSTLVRAGLAQGADPSRRRGEDSPTAPTSGAPRDFMSGTATYLMKLGPDNLGAGYATALDRKLAAAFPPLGLRLRLRDMARLEAEALTRVLAEWTEARIDIVNIGGGPTMDSLNALLLTHRRDARALADRRVRIHVLDRDEAGPHFGARALAALLAEGGPLHGLDISLRHVRYDWSDTAPLREALRECGPSAVLGSSEGALFDYGSDEAIVENLGVLRDGTPPGFTVTGSVCRDTPLARLSLGETKLKVRLLGVEGLEALARRAGWAVDAVRETPALVCVRLAKARGEGLPRL